MSEELTDLTLLVGAHGLAAGFGGAVSEMKNRAARHMAVTDRRAVELPLDGGRVKVATVAYVKGSKAKAKAAVIDHAAFMAWVAANHPEAIVQAVAEWFTVETLRKAEKDGVAVDVNGEAIPGIEVTEGTQGDPYIKVEHVPTPEAKAALMAALFDNNAAGLRSCLLALEPPASTE